MKTVGEILREYLKANGYEGLAGEECSCEIDNLCPYECADVLGCVPGHKVPCDCGEGCEWHIGIKKEDDTIKGD